MRVSVLRNSILSAALLALSSVTCFAGQQVNINTASAQALAEALTGVGETRAQAIVEHREANGRFASPDDLMEVSGIGSTTVEANRDRILVD